MVADCFSPNFRYAGPLCLLCADGLVSMAGECVECVGGASMGIAMIPMMIGCFLLFVAVVCFLLCARDATAKSLQKQARLKKMNKYFGQIKIVLCFLQILSSMPGVLDSVPWPTLFLQIVNPLGVFNLDFLKAISANSCGLNVRFFDAFLLHMMLPVLCFFSIVMAYVVVRSCTSKNRVHLYQSVSKVIILVILLLFPGLSTKVFSVFKCQNIKGIDGALLVYDLRIQCHMNEHLTFTFIAIGFLCLCKLGCLLVFVDWIVLIFIF